MEQSPKLIYVGSPQMIFNEAIKISIGKEYSFQQMTLGQLDIHMQINEVGPPPQITYKN